MATSTVAGKPNAFFTANVAKLGLAQSLSTTQIRSVAPRHPDR
jgi:succinate dehydrogenase (ubiquinone) cytochrome b560 subunit